MLRQILRHARGGTEVTYIPGNHDEMFRAWLPLGLEIAGIKLRQEAEHVTADGKRLLVMHGDEFDSVVRYAKFLALLGDWAYTVALTFNRWFNAVRRRLGYPYWSLSAWLKRQVKEAVKAIDRFESALADEARRRGFDGVVCGHIHHAEMREVQRRAVLNDGDWVESCTALVEHHDGRLELIDWAALNRLSFFAPRRAALRASCLTRSPSPRSGCGCDAMLPPAPSHRILIVTDAWLPQVNGVVRTLTTVADELRAHGPRGGGDRRRTGSAPFRARPIRTSRCRCCRAAGWCA